MLRDPALVPLSHQHQHALALCVQIDRALKGQPEEDAIEQLARSVSHQFDSEMRQHFAAEEQFLFPLLSHLEATRSLVMDLLAEHRRLEQIRDAIGRMPEAVVLAEFSVLLRSHVRKEEGVLFEEAQRLLSPERLLEVGRLLSSSL